MRRFRINEFGEIIEEKRRQESARTRTVSYDIPYLMRSEQRPPRPRKKTRPRAAWWLIAVLVGLGVLILPLVLHILR